MKICKIENCLKEAKKKQMCYRHWNQMYKYGHTFGNPHRTNFESNELIIKGCDTFIQLYNVHGWPTVQAIIDTKNIPLIKHYRWRTNKKHYVKTSVKVNGKTKDYGLHHVILGISPAEKMRGIIVGDHRDRNPLNNREDNLRTASYSQNCSNSNAVKSFIGAKCTSKFKGVTWNKADSIWQARVCKNKKDYYLGRFISEIKAAEAYDKQARKLFGDFACTNKELNLY